MQARHGIDFPLIEANAEDVPLPDASFDLAISEYGASIWCDPYRWIPEAARLLRAEGDLGFLRYSTLVVLCLPPEGLASDRLVRDQFGLHRVDCACEFASEPGGGESDQHVPVEWARRWPMEEIWKATKVRG